MDERPLAIVSDFDGTIVTRDIGDALCMTRIPEVYKEFDAAWKSGKITLVEGQQWIWPRLRMREAGFLAAVDEVARFRDGFERFFARAGELRLPFAIASNGFANYIERTLSRAGLAVETTYANRLSFDGDAIATHFPFRERFGCASCGVCKGRIVDDLKAKGFRVAFMGDGGSDRCAAGRADHLFAVAGESFERWLKEKGERYTPFASFDEVGSALGM